MKIKPLGCSLMLAVLLGACAPRRPISNENIDLALEQSHTVVKVGESVTFTANATGIAGRSDKIRWESDGGSLQNPNNMDRYAQVKYSTPGLYDVTASLIVDGELVDQEVAKVRVEPLG